MAVPWIHMLEAFDEAQLHVQVEVDSVARVDTFRACVSGTVVRVFKGDPGHVGTDVTLSLACAGPADEPGPPGVAHSLLRHIQATSVMEVFLEAISADPVRPVYSHFLDLEEPSEEPALDLQAELSAARAEKLDLQAELSAAREEKQVLHRTAPLKTAGTIIHICAYVTALVLLAKWMTDPVNSPRGPEWWGWTLLAPALLLPEALRYRQGERFSWPWWFLCVSWAITILNEGLLALAPT